MALLEWKEEYSVNVVQIDEQHRKLFRIINELEEAMSQGKGSQTLDRIFESLIDYTRYHFKFEIDILRSNGYPEAEEHERKHEAMTGQVERLKEEFEQGNAGITIKTRSFLSDWLTKHIQGTDKKYSQHLNDRGVS